MPRNVMPPATDPQDTGSWWPLSCMYGALLRTTIRTDYAMCLLKDLWQDANTIWPPLWSSGQSPRLQVQRSGLYSRCYHTSWEVVGPLSFGSTIEELLGRNSSGCGLQKPSIQP
jgi:hypothetical protein